MKVSETFWLTVVIQVQTFSILVSVILYLILPRRARLTFMELGLILIVSLATEIVASIGVFVFHANMNLASNIFNLLNLPLVILLYRSQTSWRHKSLGAYIAIALFEIFAFIDLFYIQGPHGINSYTSSISSFCIILLTLTYLFASDAPPATELRARSAMYWINVAMFFYYTAKLFIHIWVDYLVNVLQNNLIKIWIVHNALGVAFYATLCYALFLIRTEQKEVMPKTR